jgi:hypothetical protein
MKGSCQHGNASQGYISRGEFLEKLSDWRILKRPSASLSYLWDPYISVCVCVWGGGGRGKIDQPFL